MSLAAKMDSLRNFFERHQRLIATTALVSLASGVALSRHLAPGVRVEKVTLAGDSPALEFIPPGAGPHPVALLAHGFSGSKENLFWYGEALASAGFVCYSADLPGHGQSPRLYSFVETARAIGDFARDIGPVDVLLGHSMGGGTEGEAVRERLVRPKLVIAVGSMPRFGENPPPLLLLCGRFDELLPTDAVKTRADAQVIISPWSDHCFELADPLLIHAAVNAACRATGQTPPPPSAAWCWHILGALLALLGAFALVLALPDFPRHWQWARGLLVALLVGGTSYLIFSPFLDLQPHARNFLPQFAAIIILLLVFVGASNLRVSRWSFAALAVALAIACTLAASFPGVHGSIFPFHVVLCLLIFTPALFAGTIIGMLADFRGSRFSGDVAMAIIIGGCLFQLGNAPRTIPESGQPRRAIKHNSLPSPSAKSAIRG